MFIDGPNWNSLILQCLSSIAAYSPRKCWFSCIFVYVVEVVSQLLELNEMSWDIVCEIVIISIKDYEKLK